MVEKFVTFQSRGKLIHGVMHLPENDGQHPCVVVCHGFTGDHIGANRMFVHFARKASAEGLAVLRFDFVGSGDSEGEFETDTHLTGWTQDLGAALDFICTLPGIKSSKVGLLGLSFGASTVVCSAEAQTKARVAALWSPVVRLSDTFRNTILGPHRWEMLLQGKTVKNFYNKGFSLAPAFLEDLAKYDVLRAAKRFRDVPVLIVHGTKDTVVPSEHATELFRELPGPKRIEFLEDDHVFTDRLAKAVSLTLEWFKGAL
ncbi:MAG: alpha/beta hydrolase [Bacillota bacterium]